MDDVEVAHRFAFHPATTKEKQADHGSIRFGCGSLAQRFAAELPEGREKSVALTKLEEAMFWANAAIARNVPIGSSDG